MYEVALSQNDYSYQYDPKKTKLYESGLSSPYKKLIEQVRSEYNEAYSNQIAKIQKLQRRLKVYQNQRKSDEVVGDKLLFTTMQTVLASLYSDKMTVMWEPTTEGDDEVAEALNNIAKYDHRKMHKDIFDYFWGWDTCFFGHSIVYMTDFDRKKKMPVADLQNPLLFYRDPLAVAINGYIWNNRNACRYFGRWIELTKPEMQNNPEYVNLHRLKDNRQQTQDISINRQAYQNIQGLTSTFSSSFGDNQSYPLLEWCTQWIPPGETQLKKVLVTLGNDRDLIVRYHEFKTQGKPAEQWPVIDRHMYPMSHDWDGTSVADVCEDDQRQRAILKNLGIKSVKADLYPMYVYDKSKVTNTTDLNFGFNKFIGLDSLSMQDVRTALSPLQKSQFNIAVYNYLMESLGQDAERANATPQMQQGSINNKRRLATELNLVDRNVDTRYSLTARVWGWSESLYWRRWYEQYKDGFVSYIDEKVVRIDGAYGAQWRKYTKENLTGQEDPDAYIVSKTEREAKKLQESQEFVQYLTFVAQLPDTNIRYGVKKLGRLINLPKDELERLIPPTIDERIAEKENDLLSKNITVLVNINDDHVAHNEIHARAADTPAAFAHKKAHDKAMEMYKENPSSMPQYDQMQQQKASQQQQSAQGINGAASSGGGQQVPESMSRVGGYLQRDQEKRLAGIKDSQGNLPNSTR